MNPVHSVYLMAAFIGCLVSGAIYIDYQRQKKLTQELDAWIDQAPEGEKNARSTAKKNIMMCYQNQNAYLDLDELGLSTLPECINSLQHIETLHCRGNKLTDLPESIGQMPKLNHIALNNNPLHHIPHCISNLEGLETLDVASCKISDISALAGLTALKRLKINNNQLSGALPELANLTKLEILQLHGNPKVSALPENIEAFDDLHTLSTDPKLRKKYPDLFNQVASKKKESELKIIESLKTDSDLKDFVGKIFEEVPSLEIFIEKLDSVESLKNTQVQNEVTKNLKEIILKLQKNEEFKQTCKIWCDEATTSCADRILLYLTQMLIEKDLKEPSNDSSLEEIFQYAKIRAITEKCFQTGRQTALELEQPEEELEYMLAYLENAQESLGVKIPEMSFRRFIKIDDKALSAHKELITSNNFDQDIYQVIIDDENLRNLSAVKNILESVNNNPSFSPDQQDNELDQALIERLKTIQEKRKSAQIEALDTVRKHPEMADQYSTESNKHNPSTATEAAHLGGPSTKHRKRTNEFKMFSIKQFLKSITQGWSKKKNPNAHAGSHIGKLIANLWTKFTSIFSPSSNKKK